MATFIDGFEQFKDDTGTLMRLAGYTPVGSVSTAAGRKGGIALSVYRSKMTRKWQFNGDIMTIGAACFYDQRGPIIGVEKNGVGIYVWVDATTGLLNIGQTDQLNNVGYANPLKSRWYYYELTLDRNTGQATIYINGKADSSYAFPPSLSGEVTLVLNPYDVVASDFGSRQYDDFYAADAARLAPIQVTTRFPTADGAKTDWSFTGAPSAWQAVSTPVDMLDKFIYSSVDGTQQTFVSATSLPDTNPIKYLQLITLFRKATSDPMSLDFNIDDQVVREANISKDWTFRYTSMSAAGYTPANIVTAEFGVKLDLG